MPQPPVTTWKKRPFVSTPHFQHYSILFSKKMLDREMLCSVVTCALEPTPKVPRFVRRKLVKPKSSVRTKCRASKKVMYKIPQNWHLLTSCVCGTDVRSCSSLFSQCFALPTSVLVERYINHPASQTRMCFPLAVWSTIPRWPAPLPPPWSCSCSCSCVENHREELVQWHDYTAGRSCMAAV